MSPNIVFSVAAVAAAVLGFAHAQSDDNDTLATLCHPTVSTVVCIERYAHNLPLPFERAVSRKGYLIKNDTFQDTFIVLNDTSAVLDTAFSNGENASFFVFDPRGLQILGPNPTNRRIFDVDHDIEDAWHDAPVFIPSENAIVYSNFTYGEASQFRINFEDNSRYSLGKFVAEPAVYGVSSGVLHNGRLYWAHAGDASGKSSPPVPPGIVAVNVSSNEVEDVLNNYFGTRFNGPNDLTFDSNGDIFFTDSLYGWQLNMTTQEPALQTATYRFRSSTGAVNIVESSLVQPNGIAFSQDGSTCYIGDSGAYLTDFYLRTAKFPRFAYNATGQRVVYAFDVKYSPEGHYLTNKRPIWLTQDGVPEGIKVARTGEVLVASGAGVDVLSSYGTLLLRVSANMTRVTNIQFAGEGYKQLWMFGLNGIAMVEWELQGMEVH